MLVGHSYGGMVITGAADRAIDRVGHLVFLDAITPIDGESLLDFGGGVETVRDTLRVVDGVELILFPGHRAAADARAHRSRPDRVGSADG